MTNEKELANEIVNNLLYYYAHAESDDRDGMDIALENLLDTVSKLVPAAKNLHEASANGLFDYLKCPECEDWTWNRWTSPKMAL